VGVAAAAVMLILPSYVFNDKDLHKVVIIGEVVAVGALVMCMTFVFVDLGRPLQFWHLVPGLGQLNFPSSLLAGKQIDPETPRRWLLISREAGIPDKEKGGRRWSIDHLFIDQEGIPTLVEVKRSTDTRIRREVIGQLLEYAANAVVYWSIDTLREMFEFNCEANNQETDVRLSEFIGSEIEQYEFWRKVELNLQSGKVRLLFVADEIPTELQRIVEFLNVQMTPAEVLAVEIKQYVGDELKTLVPRVIGQTVEAQDKKGTKLSGKQWDGVSTQSILMRSFLPL
jgi:hypothetical protein